MATLGENIKNWLDKKTFPPSYESLPPTITIEDGLLNTIRANLEQSVKDKQERGAGIGLDNKDETLVFGTIKTGDEGSVSANSCSTPMSSSPIGSFHTHPSIDALQAPSPKDIWLLLCSNDIFEIVAGADKWLYLVVRVSDAKITTDKMKSFEVQFDRYLQETASICTTQAELEIRQEMKSLGIPGDVEPSCLKQIGYDRGIIEVCKKLKVGFYSGPSGILQRRA